VLLTAHSAYYSDETEYEVRWRAEKKIFHVLRRKCPCNLLNPKAKEKYMSQWEKMTLRNHVDGHNLLTNLERQHYYALRMVLERISA